jgi:hypothetical protein
MNPNPGNYGYGYQQPQAPPPQGWGYAMSPEMQAQADGRNLDLLAIFHFIYAGLLGFGALFFLLYVILGAVMATSVASGGGSSGDAAAVGGIFAVIGFVFMALFATKAAFLVWSGISMRKRQRHTLSFVMACISCINLPLGTTLGVFTLVVLSKPSVKWLYERTAAQGL